MSFSRAAERIEVISQRRGVVKGFTSCVGGDCRKCSKCASTTYLNNIIIPQDKDKPPSLGIDIPLTLEEQKTSYEQTYKIKFWGCRVGGGEGAYIQLCKIGDGMSCYYCILNMSNGSINLVETKKWLDYLAAKMKELKDKFEPFCDKKIAEKQYGSYCAYETYKREINADPVYKLCHSIDPIGIIRVQSLYSQVCYTVKKAFIENEKLRSDWEANKTACEFALAELGETKQIGSYYYFVKNNMVYQRKHSALHHFNNPESIRALLGPQQFDSIKEAEEFWTTQEEAEIMAEAHRRFEEEERLAAEAAKAAEREARIQAAMARLRSEKTSP